MLDFAQHRNSRTFLRLIPVALFSLFLLTTDSVQAQTSEEFDEYKVRQSASLLAPLPVAGPQFRIYLTDSPGVFVEGGVYGMYFFGYGDFVSTAGSLGVTINRHLSLTAGYQLGSRLIVNNSTSSNRMGRVPSPEFSTPFRAKILDSGSQFVWQ